MSTLRDANVRNGTSSDGTAFPLDALENRRCGKHTRIASDSNTCTKAQPTDRQRTVLICALGRRKGKERSGNTKMESTSKYIRNYKQDLISNITNNLKVRETSNIVGKKGSQIKSS